MSITVFCRMEKLYICIYMFDGLNLKVLRPKTIMHCQKR